MASMAGKSTSEMIIHFFETGGIVNEVTNPGFVWWSGFQCTVFYYLSAYVFQFFTPEEAWALVCVLLLGHSVLTNTFGLLIDFTLPFRRLCMLFLRTSPGMADPPPSRQKEKKQ